MAQGAIARLDEVAVRPLDEHSRQVAWVVSHHEALFAAPDILRQGWRPISDAEQVDAVPAQLPPLFGKEPDPEPKPVRWQSEGRVAHVLAPERNRWPVQARVDLVVILAHYLEHKPALQLAHRHCRATGRRDPAGR